ncbi:MAG: hypothetical protein SVU32_06800, partial [Candidatus Nanohaloarchaea archaeon]|nr:hypothetical protein [Candidatus Nanohaloarchaea archaeon]
SSTLVDATLHDLIDTMQGLVPAKDDPEAYQDSLETYRRAIENLDISAYSVLDTDNTYRITTVTDPETLHNNTVMAETCIGFDVSFDYLMDSEFGDIFEQQVSDDHTYILQVEKNGQQKGYSRNLLMEDGDGNRFLGIDTTEVDRNDYDPHAVQALGLAGIHLGRDLGVDYIGMAAADGRAKEVNSGYSNTSRSIEYEKIGESLDMVSNLFSFRDRRTFDLLFEDPV